MGRLINADAIVHYQTYDDEHETFPEHEGTIAEFLDSMTDEGCPEPVDAVPVVRCEDCRFWSKYLGSSAAPQYHECMARMTHIGNLYTTAGEYCSRGERKDGDGNG